MALKDFLNPIMSGVSVVGNVVSSALTNKARKKEAERQNQWNLEQWNRQNAYDSPSAQMQRLTDAGLNPNLIYGSMSSGSPSAPATSASGFLETPQIDMSPIKYAAEIELAKSQARKNNADARSTDRLTLLEIQKEFGDTPMSASTLRFIQANEDNAIASANKSRSDVEVNLQRISLMSEEQRKIFLENLFSESTFDTRVQRLVSETNLSQKIAANYQRVIDSAVAEAYSRVAYNNELTRTSHAQGQLYHGQWQMLGKEFSAFDVRLQRKLSKTELNLQNALVEYYESADDVNTAQKKYLKALKYAVDFATEQGEKWDDTERGVNLATQILDSFTNAMKANVTTPVKK